jgi:hypothetical protein
MKLKILTSFIGLSICTSVYGLDVYPSGNDTTITQSYVLDTPGDISSLPDDLGYDTQVVLRGAGDYLLSELEPYIDGVKYLVTDINYQTEPGTNNWDVFLVADSDFDGDLAPEFINNNSAGVHAKIKLMDLYLNKFSNDIVELMRFNYGTDSGEIQVVEENPSSDYFYYIETCAGGGAVCVKRRYSDEYLENLQNDLRNMRIASAGVQNNSRMLLRPMGLIHRYELIDAYDWDDEFFISVEPLYLTTNDFQNMGLRFKAGTKIGGRLRAGMVAYAMHSDFDNDVSDFKSETYGANLRARYDLTDVLFLRGIGGFSFSTIKCPGALNGTTRVDNPNATGFYAGTDIGAKFNFDSGVYWSPFAGIGFDTSHVVDVDETDSFLRAGTDVGYDYFMDGVKYSYALRLGMNSHGLFDANLAFNAWTVADKIGGGVSVGVMDTDFGLAGVFTANVRFAF